MAVNEPQIPMREFSFEDLIGGSDEAGDSYFDHQHFKDFASLEDEHYWHLYRRTIVFDRVREHCGRDGARFVDIGCGIGTVATYLNQNGYHVDYADVHGEALRFARQRAEERIASLRRPLRFVRVDITKQKLLGAYDGALLLDVLEHLPDDRLVLRNVRDQLAPAGERFIIFTVPAFNFLWSPWDDLNHHQRRYTLATAKRLAEDCGLKVLRATYFFLPLFFGAAAVKGQRALTNSVLRLRPQGPPKRIGELAEGKSYPIVNRAMLRILSAERAWLRRRDLPLGTSLICVART